ncbi:hypothetical protein FA15DRAFT_244089 [Coprinopsis marcescibilis]|uniref:Uncharacterized protein n=1 Tax=Coprinopsis marcescibilis TaxID=230819 RepID=A0A5C3KFQ0_COPMA|nr:hypothetical protein FA15DRAFT_244089 [Coprinopsis marcescibilis]
MPAFRHSTTPAPIDTKPSAAPAPPSEREQHENQVQSPPLSPLLHVREDRDALAMEHDRQKYLKTIDRARNKARKAFGMDKKRSNSKARGGAGTGGPGENQRPHHHHGAQERSVTVGDDKEVDFWLPSYGGITVTTPPGYPLSVSDNTATNTSVEMRLADLVYAPNARKTRKKKSGGLGGEYEVVPNVRSVIVLDEHQFVVRDPTADLDDGEAWECIEDEKVERKVTYASVAAAALNN